MPICKACVAVLTKVCLRIQRPSPGGEQTFEGYVLRVPYCCRTELALRPEKMQPDSTIEFLRTRLMNTLASAVRERQIIVETICLAALALRKHGPPAYDSALRVLLSLQLRDGSWPAFTGDDCGNCVATALAVCLLTSIRSTSSRWAAGVNWLLNAKGREAHWFWRWKFQTIDTSVTFHPRKYGWGWLLDTTSWVIPTSFSLIALQQIGNAGLTEEARLKERVTLGVSMLFDRICPGGGWNAGNGLAFGVALAPYIDATSIALLAARGHEHDAAKPSLSWLATRIRDCRSPYSLAWGILALAAYHEETELRDASVHASDAVRVAIEKDRIASDTTLAICALALEAVDGDNVFAVRA